MNTSSLKQIRDWHVELDIAPNAHSSLLMCCGNTRVICAANIESRQPKWINDANQGWVTAEYAMLPCSTIGRNRRDIGRVNGRAQEIQRLVGRSLRACIDLKSLGPVTIHIDCDVLQADGGTRCASITGAWIALYRCLEKAKQQGLIKRNPIHSQVAAIGVGLIGGEVTLDLNYEQDVQADVDMNLVMTEKGLLVEVQGTAEGAPFSAEDLGSCIERATFALQPVYTMQMQAATAPISSERKECFYA